VDGGQPSDRQQLCVRSISAAQEAYWLVMTRLHCRACRLPVPTSLRHVAAGGGSNTFSVESAVVRPIGGNSGSDSASGAGTPSSPSPCSSTAASGAAADGASAADGSSSSSSSSSSEEAAGNGGDHDAAAVFRQGAEAYHMPPLQLVPPGTSFDPKASPEVQVRRTAVRMSQSDSLSTAELLLAAA
jgi:hypothetical protein